MTTANAATDAAATAAVAVDVDVDVVARYGAGDLRDGECVQRLRGRIGVDGLVVFSGIDSPARMLAAAAEVMRVIPHPDSDHRGLTTLTDLGPAGEQPNAAGFSRRGLAPHTDRSGVADPPPLLMTACARPAGSGGTCLLVDGQAVHEDLARAAPEALPALLRPGSALFGGAAGHLGSVLVDLTHPPGTAGPAGSSRMGRRALRLRLDELVMFSTQAAAWLPVLRATIDRHTPALDLAAQQGYLLDNHRWLHGRTAYTGARILYRLHGAPLPELSLRPGIPLTRNAQPDRPGRSATAA